MSLEQDILSREPINNARIKMYADNVRLGIKMLEKMGCKVDVSRNGYVRRTDGKSEAFFEHKVFVTKEEEF